MKAGISVEVRLPQGSIGFQSTIDVDPETVRYVSKKMKVNETLRIRLNAVVKELALLACQSKFPAAVTIEGETTELEGQNTGDFGLIYAVRNGEEFGTAPFELDLNDTIGEILILNRSTKENDIQILIGEFRDELPLPAPAPIPDDSLAAGQQTLNLEHATKS